MVVRHATDRGSSGKRRDASSARSGSRRESIEEKAREVPFSSPFGLVPGDAS